MNRRISRLGIGLLLCYSLLFLQLNRVQVFQAEKLNDHPENYRNIVSRFDRPRGVISSSDGAVLARSVPTPGGDYERLRQYPGGELFGHITGFLSLEFGADGLEQQYNELLSGTTVEQQYRGLSDLLVTRDRTADLVLEMRSDVQAAARAALGERRGSIVVLEPRTGAVLAMWSWPSYDPNLLSSHQLVAASQARAALLADGSQPLLARAYRERYFPGSTFKLVTAGTGLTRGLVGAEAPVYPTRQGYVPPASAQPIGNFGAASCGGTVLSALIVSCNTAFAEMGAETIGPDDMVAGASEFGFNARPPIDLPDAAISRFPTDFGARISGPGGAHSVYENSAALAQASIGQNDVAATPLTMALVAAAAATDGSIPAPRVVHEARDAEGKVIETFPARRWRTAMDPRAAAVLRQGMEAVVTSGTARGLAIGGLTIGAKTGTAEVGGDRPETNAWVVGYAGRVGQPPSIAFSVLIEADQAVGEQTGGRVAVPVAAEVVAAALRAVG